MRTLKIGDKNIRQYTVADLMTKLDISKVTALNLLKAGKIKSIRIGRQYWINEVDLVDFLLGGSPRKNIFYGEKTTHRFKNPILRFFLSRLLK